MERLIVLFAGNGSSPHGVCFSLAEYKDTPTDIPARWMAIAVLLGTREIVPVRLR
jgi:hypothetical protein